MALLNSSTDWFDAPGVAQGMDVTAGTGTRGTTRRWVAVGHSTAADSREAGQEAARAALRSEDAALVLAFVSPWHDPLAVSAGIRGVTGQVPLAGCTTHGEIHSGGPCDRGVVVVAFGGPGFHVETAVAQDVNGRQREAGTELAACVRAVDGHPHQVLIVLTDGFIRDQEQILRGVYQELGASVPLFGGAAADGWKMDRAYELHGEEVYSGSAVAVALSSDAPIGIGIAHGWRTAGEPMAVTQAAEGRVRTLDDRPALDAYLDRLAAPAEAYQDEAAFTRFALAHPVGVRRRGGVEMRNLSTEPDLTGRTLGGGGAIAEGGLIWAMSGCTGELEDAAAVACRAALDHLGDAEAVGLLTFSCAALRAVIGDEGIAREVSGMRAVLGDRPFGGFYTYGEIARTRGIGGFHNQTAVVLAVA